MSESFDVRLMSFSVVTFLTKWLNVAVNVFATVGKTLDVVKSQIWLLLIALSTFEFILKQLDEPVTWCKCTYCLTSASMKPGFGPGSLHAELA